MRERINAMFSCCATASPDACCRRHIPQHQTVDRWVSRFRDDGTWESPNHHLVMLDRVRAGREASPTGGVVDPQRPDHRGRWPAWRMSWGRPLATPKGRRHEDQGASGTL
jgi:putative transposase